MLLSDTIDMSTAEERWRRIVGVYLRINGKTYSETMNLSMNMTLNVTLILIKYLKKKPLEAEWLAYYEMYALFKEKYKGIIKDQTFISEGDILDLVKLKTNNDTTKSLFEAEMPPQTYVRNDVGGFWV